MKTLAVFIVTCFLLAASPELFALGQQFNQRKPGVTDQDIIIRIADISEYALFYPFQIDGFSMEVIAIMAADKTIRTAFNACAECYVLGKGYYVQKRTVLICQQCGDEFPPEKIEIQTGGCNPIPIFPGDKTQTASAITISKEYLSTAKAMFIKMKEDAE